MKKIYNIPVFDVIMFEEELLIGNGSVGANIYDKDGNYKGSIGNGGGASSTDENHPTPGAKSSSYSIWDDEEE